LHVATRDVPTSGSQCGKNPAHYLGNDGYDPADRVQRWSASNPALCCRPAWFLGGILHRGNFKVPL